MLSVFDVGKRFMTGAAILVRIFNAWTVPHQRETLRSGWQNGQDYYFSVLYILFFLYGCHGAQPAAEKVLS
jgi:hypothetical protein